MKKIILVLRYIMIVTLLFFATSCNSDTNKINEIGDQKKVNLVIDAQQYAKVESDRTTGKGNTASDPFTINNVERVGDILKVEVSYSGGCEEHTFDIIWGGQILLTHPCLINMTLTHDANGDLCERQVTETLEIDLNKLVGDVDAKDSCVYNIFNVLNSSEDPDAVVSNI